MSLIKLILNPAAGEVQSGKNINSFFIKAAKKGFRVEMVPFQAAILQEALQACPQDTRAIVVAGGDGSLNWVVNILLHLDPPYPPLAILPWGTANDFSSNLLQSSFSMDKLLDAIAGDKSRSVDVGAVNDRYFINVVGAGLLVDVAHNTRSSLKQSIGMLAYYLEGALNLPDYKPFPLQIERDGRTEEMDVDLFLVLNGKTAGGVRSLGPGAQLDDGKLDVLIIKKSGVPGLISLIPRLLAGQHTTDSRVLYFQSEKFSLHTPSRVETDLDGEKGPPFPLHFSVLHKKLDFISF